MLVRQSADSVRNQIAYQPTCFEIQNTFKLNVYGFCIQILIATKISNLFLLKEIFHLNMVNLEFSYYESNWTKKISISCLNNLEILEVYMRSTHYNLPLRKNV